MTEARAIALTLAARIKEQHDLDQVDIQPFGIIESQKGTIYLRPFSTYRVSQILQTFPETRDYAFGRL